MQRVMAAKVMPVSRTSTATWWLWIPWMLVGGAYAVAPFLLGFGLWGGMVVYGIIQGYLAQRAAPCSGRWLIASLAALALNLSLLVSPTSLPAHSIVPFLSSALHLDVRHEYMALEGLTCAIIWTIFAAAQWLGVFRRTLPRTQWRHAVLWVAASCLSATIMGAANATLASGTASASWVTQVAHDSVSQVVLALVCGLVFNTIYGAATIGMLLWLTGRGRTHSS